MELDIHIRVARPVGQAIWVKEDLAMRGAKGGIG